MTVCWNERRGLGGGGAYHGGGGACDAATRHHIYTFLCAYVCNVLYCSRVLSSNNSFCLGFHSIVALLLLDRGSAENITIESVDYTSTVSCTRNPF